MASLVLCVVADGSTLVTVACGRGRRAAASRGGRAALFGRLVWLARLVVDFPRQAVRYQGAARDALLAHGRHRAFRRELHTHVADKALARLRLLVHHRRRHLVAEPKAASTYLSRNLRSEQRADALQLHRTAVLHVQLHDFRQRQQRGVHVRGRSRRRVGDVLAQLLGRHRRALRHGSHRPFLAALPFAFDFLNKCHNINILSWVIKGSSVMPFVEVSGRHCRGLDSTTSRSQRDNVASRPRQLLINKPHRIAKRTLVMEKQDSIISFFSDKVYIPSIILSVGCR